MAIYLSLKLEVFSSKSTADILLELEFLLLITSFVRTDKQRNKQTDKMETRLCSEIKPLGRASPGHEAIKFLKIQSIQVL